MHNIEIKRRRRKRGRFILLLLGLSPLLSFFVFKEEWKARSVAVTWLWLFLAICFFAWGLSPKANFSWTQPVHGHELRWLIKERILRGFVVLLATSIAFFIAFPVAQETIHTFHYGARSLTAIKGTVEDNRFNFGLYFLEQTVVVTDARGIRHKFEGYFFSHPARIGETYEFLIMPKNKLILEWRTIQQ